MQLQYLYEGMRLFITPQPCNFFILAVVAALLQYSCHFQLFSSNTSSV